MLKGWVFVHEIYFFFAAGWSRRILVPCVLLRCLHVLARTQVESRLRSELRLLRAHLHIVVLVLGGQLAVFEALTEHLQAICWCARTKPICGGRVCLRHHLSGQEFFVFQLIQQFCLVGRRGQPGLLSWRCPRTRLLDTTCVVCQPLPSLANCLGGAKTQLLFISSAYQAVY